MGKLGLLAEKNHDAPKLRGYFPVAAEIKYCIEGICYAAISSEDKGARGGH